LVHRANKFSFSPEYIVYFIHRVPFRHKLKFLFILIDLPDVGVKRNTVPVLFAPNDRGKADCTFLSYS